MKDGLDGVLSGYTLRFCDTETHNKTQTKEFLSF